MGLFSWLFSRKKVNKVEEESDGQEQYFKEDFDPKSEKQTKKKSDKKLAVENQVDGAD